MQLKAKPVLPCLLWLACAAFANAEDYEALVERAFDALDNEFSEHWSYTETSEQDDSIYVASFDPRRPQEQRWSLDSIDGHDPTDKPIKPAKGVKLSTFDTRLAFGRAAKNGPIVPLSVDMKVQGRAYLVVEIDETEKIRYSNFERVIEKPERH